MNIDHYFTVPYVDGGRDIAVGLDCWGLVRHVLHHEFNLPLLERFGCVDRHDSEADIHRCFDDSQASFKLCQPKAGALACCFLKCGDDLIFHHVGVCLNASDVLQTASSHGVKTTSVRAFKRLATVVKFYEFIY